MATGKVGWAVGFESPFTACLPEWGLEMVPFGKDGSVKN